MLSGVPGEVQQSEGETMKRLEMREETRRATSDVCAILMAEFGIVASFEQVRRIAEVVDRDVLKFGRAAKSMTPDQWREAEGQMVVSSEMP